MTRRRVILCLQLSALLLCWAAVNIIQHGVPAP